MFMLMAEINRKQAVLSLPTYEWKQLLSIPPVVGTTCYDSQNVIAHLFDVLVVGQKGKRCERITPTW